MLVFSIRSTTELSLLRVVQPNGQDAGRRSLVSGSSVSVCGRTARCQEKTHTNESTRAEIQTFWLGTYCECKRSVFSFKNTTYSLQTLMKVSFSNKYQQFETAKLLWLKKEINGVSLTFRG